MTFPSEQFTLKFKSSCSKDDAVAKLLGWLKGPIHHEVIEITEHGVSLEQLIHMETLVFSLEKHLSLLRQEAMYRASELVDGGVQKELIDEKLEEVLDIEDLISLAEKYMRDVEDELDKRDLSTLQIDYLATDRAGRVHIKINSLGAWAHKKYGISIDGYENNTKPEQKVYRLREQERLILEEIAKFNLDPKRLPKIKKGKSTIKVEIKEILASNPLFKGSTVFKRAWDQLRSDGRIANEQ